MLGMVSSGGLWLLGQAEPSLPSGLTTLGPPAMTIGAGAWFLRWFVLTYIPEQNALHAAQLKAQAESLTKLADTHKEVTTYLSLSFERNAQQLRDDYKDDRNKFIEVLRGVSDGPADASRPTNQR